MLDTWGKGRDKRWEGENHGLLFIFTYIKWRQGEYFNIIDFESWMLQSISAAPVTGENSSRERVSQGDMTHIDMLHVTYILILGKGHIFVKSATDGDNF